MEKILTIDGLTEFLRDIDGQAFGVSRIYSQMGDLIDTEDYRSSEYDEDLLLGLVDDIMKEYGETAKVEIVKQLTHEQIVELLGFDFVEVK